MRHAWLALLLCVGAAAAQTWTVRIEEPTGLYRRTNETVAVPLAKVGGKTDGFTVLDPQGRELPWQVSAAGQLLFPASLMPGELPLYRVSCCTPSNGPFANTIVLRRIGMQRVEFGNSHFRAVIDLRTAAIVEVYALRAASHKQLNLVETTPEGAEALKGDVHETVPEAKTFSPPPVAGVPGPNTGWTTPGVTSFDKVELLESGPLRGRLRVGTWEITWTAGGAWFRWKAANGFRFAAISATPYLPFNRCLDGSEYAGPTGPGEPEREPNAIAARYGPKLPGGHIVYYQKEENYGALGIVALDERLQWTGAGSRRVLAAATGATEIAVTFPQWNGGDTVLEARRENRMLRQPLLVSVEPGGAATVREPSSRAPAARPIAQIAPFAQQELSLNGDWELAWAEKGEGPPASAWRTVKVPGSAHVQWLDASKIYSREAEWISTKEWWYRKRVEVPAAFRGKRLRLQFEATDYYADIFVNGVRLGRHEGYIDPHEWDVGDDLREILVRVWTPVGYYWKHRQYTVKGSYGAVDQKPDDITALGITRAVRLIASQPGPVIRDIAVNTRLLTGANAAEVDLDLEADAPLPDGFRWQASLRPRNFQSNGTFAATTTASSKLTLHVDKPELWWTWDHGKPNLYTLDVRLIDAAGNAVDGRSLAVGIREIERIGWDFYLNRKRLFIRGTNYYFHLYLSEMDRAKYERDVTLMLGMNINMIRVHCHFSNREFYDLADERGILIWQDFLEAWYPHDRGFAQRAAVLYDNHIRYVRNHPSIALWATSDEEDFENYHEITKHLAPRPFFLDPQHRPVVRSTGRFGDSHVYHGWYDGSIWQYAEMTEQFVSELGATGLPNYETIAKYMPGQWPIEDHKEEWMWRRLQIPEAMRAWGEPAPGMTLQEYIPQTQAYVARLFQLAIERMRRRKWNGSSGILHFHAIDIWPSITMAAIDFDRVPTKTYDTVRRSFAPVAALFEYDRDKWKRGERIRCGLWAVNDRWEPVPGASLRWTLLRGGTAVRNGTLAANLAADSSMKAGAVEFNAIEAGAYELRAEIVDARGAVISENIFEFRVVD